MVDDILKAVGVKDIASIGEPIVQVVGMNTLNILNMQGVVLLENCEILLKGNKNFNIRIIGENLVCKMMNKNEATIVGRIENVSWEKTI